MKKYEFTGETINYFERKLNRIRRLSDGLVGGWIEKEENLSHEGYCFVYNNAKVYGNATIRNNATIRDNAIIRGNAIICDSSLIRDNARIRDNAIIFDSSLIQNNAVVCDNATVRGNATVRDRATVRGNAIIRDNTMVCDDAEVYGDTRINNGIITGEIQIPFKNFEVYRGYKSRKVTAILTLDDKWLFNVGCQKLITKEEFIDRIYNIEGGLEKNPHREFYLKILKMF